MFGFDFLLVGVIIVCEGDQISLLCMLRFNPFPRGLS